MSVISGILGSQATTDAAGKAADATTEASQLSNATQMEMYNRSVDLEEPFRQAGLAALPDELAAYKAGAEQIPGLVSSAFATKDGLSPAGQFAWEQTQSKSEDALAARGLLNSGAGLELTAENAQSVAAQDYTDSWNKKLQAEQLALGQNPTGVGANTAANMGSAATSTGSGMAANTMSGATSAAGYYNQAGLAQGQMYSNQGAEATGLVAGAIKNYYGNQVRASAANASSAATAYGANAAEASFEDAMYMAEGGRPEPGKPVVVGEEGPETFVPDQAGTVIPNPSTQAKMTSTPGAGLSRTGKNQPDKADWLKLEGIQSEAEP